MTEGYVSDRAPTRVLPVYPVGRLHDSIHLHSGQLTAEAVEDDEPTSVSGFGRVVFEFLPTPHGKWELVTLDISASLSAYELLLPEADLTDSEIQIPPSSHVIPDLELPQATSYSLIDARLEPGWIGCTDAMTSVRFVVINLPIDLGEITIRDPQGAVYLGRHELKAVGWTITIDAIPSLGRLLGDLKKTAGYGVTHAAELRRDDGQCFTAAECDEILGALFVLLRFARGGDVGVALPTGFDGVGRAVAVNWSCTRVDPGGYRLNWYPEHQGATLANLWPSVLTKYRDDYWRSVLRQLCGSHVAANEPPIDRGILTAAAAIETISWAVFVETEHWLTPEGYDKLRFEDRLRLLMRWAHVPSTLAPSEPALLKRATAHTTDAAEAVAWVRNRIAHPDRRSQLTHDHKTEAWLLTSWCLELLILRILDYQSTYADRRKRHRWSGDVDPVPWARIEAP